MSSSLDDAFDGDGWLDQSDLDLSAHRVSALLVAHDGAHWLPRLLAALAAQSVPPDLLVAVDTGSRDRSAALLYEALGTGQVLLADRLEGFPAAVARATGRLPAARTDVIEWLWLLHDDCVPAPNCLEQLLRQAGRVPAAAVVGPKVRDLDDPRVLVEIGVTTDLGGRLSTGLERGELDQGQHDDVREVLAVGTAGMLVRRDVFDALGGLDPELPLLRDDIDLCWRVNAAGHEVVVAPDARVDHARALVTGRRRPDAQPGRPAGVDRRHAVRVVMANTTGWRAPVTVLRLVLGCLVRSLGFLLTRRPGASLDELRAILESLGRPLRLARARRRRRATATLGTADLKPLLGRRRNRLRLFADAFGELVGGSTDGDTGLLSEPTGDGLHGDTEAPAARRSMLLTFVRRPMVVAALALTLVSLVAGRSLLGSGVLAGGQLLPTPAGASDLFALYRQSWHEVGPGTATPAPPYLVVLAALSVLTLGNASLLVALLLLLVVPLAAVSAYLALRTVTRSVPVRVGAACVYALLPVVTSSVAAGRLGLLVASVLLPWLLSRLYRLVWGEPGAGGGVLSSAWGTGLLLAVVACVAPLLYPLVLVLLVLGLVGLVVSADARVLRRSLGALAVAAAPPALLYPWTEHLLANPRLFTLGIAPDSASPALVDPTLPGWALLLGQPGGPVSGPRWLLAALPLLALAGLLRRRNMRGAAAGWAVALVGFAAALLVQHETVTTATGLTLPGWPGIPLLLSGCGLLVAATVAADKLGDSLRAVSFGLRQPVAVLLVAAVAVAPAVAAVAWVVRGAQGPVGRTEATLLPAFAAVTVQPGERVLYLRGSGSQVRFALSGPDGATLGDGDLTPTAGQRDHLEQVVQSLVAPGGSGGGQGLATYAVRYVVAPAPVPGSLVDALDDQQGLSRKPVSGGIALWEVTAPSTPLELLGADLAAGALDRTGPDPAVLRDHPPVAVDRRALAGGAQLPPGDPGRLLVLSEAVDQGWRATLDGQRLTPVRAWGWAQAFEVPAGGGRLVVDRTDGRSTRLWVQLGLLALVVVLAAPSPRGSGGWAQRQQPDDEPDTDTTPATVPTTIVTTGSATTPGTETGTTTGTTTTTGGDR